ncbi:MAG: hypothetical protein HKN70_11190 [Gammaproteobacteria bacterium]|nr:hypothetical protein [Gammaproteobacteria bacterium]
MQSLRNLLVVALATCLVACSHSTMTPTDASSPATPDAQGSGLSTADVSEAMTWGASDNVRQIKHIYIASQPDDAALQRAQAAGVTTVVNLREPHEYDWNEQAATAVLGMKYLNIPIPKQGASFDRMTLQRIERIVMQNRDGGVLLHCSSGNRAAAWLAAHLTDTHGMSDPEALAIAGKAGLTHAATKERVQRYMDER